MRNILLIACCLAAAVPAALSAAEVPQTDSSYIDANGTAHVTRVVPVPKTVSPEAQRVLARQVPDDPTPVPLQTRRTHTDEWQARAGEEARKVYPVKSIEEKTIAGVPTRVITPLNIPTGKQDRILLNVHGGGFNSDSGSLTETIPVANLSSTKTIAVLYRLAPEHPFPAAVDDTIAVYKELLKTYRPQKIALFGTSAGAILTAEVAVRLKQLGLPLPGALGIFSGLGDFSKPGDSMALFSLQGLAGHMEPPSDNRGDRAYAGGTSLQDQVLSPMYADLKGMPPSLFITSTRDMLLSGTCSLQRAFLRAGDDAQLVVFEALAHAFWNDVRLPESREAHRIMAGFFDKALGR